MNMDSNIINLACQVVFFLNVNCSLNFLVDGICSIRDLEAKFL